MRLKNKKLIATGIIALFVIILFGIIELPHHWAKRHFRAALATTSQNALDYVNPATAKKRLLTAKQQQKKMKNFKRHFFAPWHGKPLYFSAQSVKTYTDETNQHFLKKPSWGPDFYIHNKKWIKQLIHNENMSKFSTDQLQPAIMLRNTDVRALPTILPAFNNPKSAGEGYPFDNLQMARIHAGSPVTIIHQTRDSAWQLIITPSYYGWVPTSTVINVTHDIQQFWQQKHYIAIVRDNTPIVNQHGKFLLSANIGAAFPVITETNDQFKIKIVVRDANDQAKMINAWVKKSAAVRMPQAATPYNIARLANRMHGQTYGWGGMANLRDCSATMKDLFAPFGIWLPRNSSQQAIAGKFISLATLSDAQKEKIIRQKAIPFLTLMWMPGHITLYVGSRNGKYYFYQNLWGLHRISFSGKEGRAIIGENVIAPAQLGSNYINIKATLLNMAQGLNLLGG